MKPETAIILDSIDFEILRFQKSQLIELMMGVKNTEKAMAIEGILSLIDTIQDQAVSSKQLTEGGVYGEIEF